MRDACATIFNCGVARVHPLTRDIFSVMNDDEALVALFAFIIAVVTMGQWYLPLLRVKRLVCPMSLRVPLLITPLACIAGLIVVVRNFADPQVTGAIVYQALFVFAGVAWFAVPEIILPLLGISLCEDAVGRRNPAAVIALCGALLATTAVFAASNIGTGPTIDTTLGPAALGTAMLVAAWFIHRLLSPAWEDVAVGRDVAAALRLSAMFLSTALILAPAVAGDWVSTDTTVHDCLRRIAPLLTIVFAAAVVDRFRSPTAQHPRPPLITAGICPSACLIVAAAVVAKWWR